MDQVKVAMAGGRLKAGDRLPPIRDVAVQVRVNRNTVARVYAELEREGVVYSRAGQGCFVGDGAALTLSDTEQRRRLMGWVDDFITHATLFGMSRESISELFFERLDAILHKSGVAKPKGGSAQ
jgi:GntR family transcriptional regulator